MCIRDRRYWLRRVTRSLKEGGSLKTAARLMVWQTTIVSTRHSSCKRWTRVLIFEPTTSGLASGGERSLEPISKITIWGCRRLTKCKSNLDSLSTVRPRTPRKVICAERDKLRSRRTLASMPLDKNNSKRRTKEWPIMRTWGLGDMTNLKNNKKDILNSGSEGWRWAAVKFAKACYVWRPRGRLWGTQLVLYPNLKWRRDQVLFQISSWLVVLQQVIFRQVIYQVLWSILDYFVSNWTLLTVIPANYLC